MILANPPAAEHARTYRVMCFRTVVPAPRNYQCGKFDCYAPPFHETKCQRVLWCLAVNPLDQTWGRAGVWASARSGQ